MRRPVAALVALVLLVGGCDDGTDPDVARLDSAESALAKQPRDPRAYERVVQAGYDGAQNRLDTAAGVYERDARPFLDRAVAVWPRYLRVVRGRPAVTTASLVSRIYDQGLRRPLDAAAAAALVTEQRPSARSYLYLADLYWRGGRPDDARTAAQNALELADPSERVRVRAAIRLFER